ncbi:hypothetical protein AYO44_03190 [Planctomycetaceae bacterium SCGC AG-212-F19]|nr:hypothetical protein AYO44_03190 [Planctomycetaceae bacterium SCGC AG-212-F19]
MSYGTVDPRKQAIARLVFGVALLGTGLIMIFWNFRWLASAMQGPVPITIAELRQLTDPGQLPNPWVSFTFDQAIDTKLSLVASKGGKTTPKSHYFLVQVQDRWLIAELPYNHAGNQVVGYLDIWSTPLRREAVAKVHANQPAEASQILPFQLDAEYGYRGQCLAMVAVAVFCIVCGLVLAASARPVLATHAPSDYGHDRPNPPPNFRPADPEAT